jgi:hypothetical protein
MIHDPHPNEAAMEIRRPGPASFSDTNGLVAAFLDDIAERPIPREAEPTIGEIRQAVAAGTATAAMAIRIIELFPPNKSPWGV